MYESTASVPSCGSNASPLGLLTTGLRGCAFSCKARAPATARGQREIRPPPSLICIAHLFGMYRSFVWYVSLICLVCGPRGTREVRGCGQQWAAARAAVEELACDSCVIVSLICLVCIAHFFGMYRGTRVLFVCNAPSYRPLDGTCSDPYKSTNRCEAQHLQTNERYTPNK